MARPMSVVVMGVSGSGKSAVAAELAARLGLACVDADDLHAAASVAKMRAGIALSDDDRWPWLDRVGQRLQQVQGTTGTVVACSALRRAYRARLRNSCLGMHFVYLHGEAGLIESRMRARQGHYMPPSLLASQLQALEPPGADEPDVLHVPIDQPLAAVVDQACAALVLAHPQPWPAPQVPQP